MIKNIKILNYNLNWEEKFMLIQNDPVTCALHFDYQYHQFLGHSLMSNAAPVGKILDWFSQSRVSAEWLTPHSYANLA